CFRDEDLRADRQPEFTQIDIEMSFGDEETIFATVENLMVEIFKGTIGFTLPEHFDRLTWKEAMERYGSDKPDTRYGYEIQNISSIFEHTEFQVFKSVLEEGGIIDCIKFDGLASFYSRKKLDELQDFVKHGFKAKALAYLKMENGTLTGSIAKPLSEEEKTKLIEQLEIKDDDLLLVIADKAKVAQSALGALRVRLAREHEFASKDDYRFVWITDFPMFEFSEEENRYVAAHHPFTSPKLSLEEMDKLFTDPANVSSRAYDLVLNGYELLSGSIRIHDQVMQEKVFEAIGLTMEQAKERFGFFLDAFRYGTPPHGGVGIGLERLVMVLCQTENIRDVVAFPTTNSALDLMSEAPNVVDEEQLEVLGIELKKSNE
ncbi:MAG: aspartate--tRNA ligase, partial [Solobacterium sp.]|nr:aspartate--tRNA ligase [Solobacterium sp.]